MEGDTKLPLIKRGSIIKGPFWDQPIEVNYFSDLGELIEIAGSKARSREHIEQILHKEELKLISIVDDGVGLSADPREVFLALEALRYRFASLYDPLLGVNTSKIDPLPHQIEAVYGYVLKLPRTRFLIADDPGAGKTIMAGLIIKELKLRNVVRRILIVVPGHLKDQWSREMADKFGEHFFLVDRSSFDNSYGENIWTRESQIITSIDFAKRKDVLPSLRSVQFDLIIVDEAHKMSAYRYGDKTSKTERYRLGEVLSNITEHLLFLTATPHKGDPDNFRLFLDLLQPGFFATNKDIERSIKDGDNPLFIRRIKEDLRDFDGKPLFLPRYVKTIAFNIGVHSPKEKELYNDLSRYVKEQYNKALMSDKKRNVAFALVILQRRLASSTYALCESLKRRRKRLQELLEQSPHKEGDDEINLDIESIDDMNEEERWKEEEKWEALSVSKNLEELKKEIEIIDDLIKRADQMIKEEEDIKLREFKKALQELSERYPDHNDKKVLVFTESKDTLTYLEGKIRKWGYKVNTIHGGMSLQDRVKEEKVFKNETQIMVATEAAGEGINLQFCHLMINYDIPWNPNRLEQRMGRIHRYGQQKEVYVINLVAEDTREGKILKTLFDKLEEIKSKLGSDKVFDVVSEILRDKSLSQLLVEAAASARGLDEILKEIDIKVDKEYIAKVKENLGESLATHYIDYTRIRDMSQKAKENRLIPEYTQNFFKKAFEKVGGKLRLRNDGLLAIDSIPYEIKSVSEQGDFSQRYGQINKQYPRVTFDKEVAFRNPDAEFISFGHPLFEAVMKWVEDNLTSSLLEGATFIDPDGRLDGFILFYEGGIKDSTGAVAGKKLFSFYINGDNVKPIQPWIIWDLQESPSHEKFNVDFDMLKQKAKVSAIQELSKYRDELLTERERQAKIKEKYGLTSLDYLIVQLDQELIELNERREKGENVDLVMRMKEEKKRQYGQNKKKLIEAIEKEKTLIMDSPRFVGIIRVKPANEAPDEGISDEEVEQIGMQIAMRYERSQGRQPEDVSDQNLGFDIRSTDNHGRIRYIEVKTRSEIGPISMTPNEWFKASMLKEEYYLYAVMNARQEPRLFIVQNPAKNLKPEEKLEVIRFIMPFEDIETLGKPVQFQ